MNQELFKTDEISATITKIILESQKYCFIVSPYYCAWEHLMRALATAAEQQKKVVFFIRDEPEYHEGGKYYESSIKPLINWRFDIVYVKNLHAKLYMNERQILVTSMNVFVTSSQMNYEIGLTKFGCSDLYKKNFIYNELMGSKQYCSIVEGRYFKEEREKEEAEKKKKEERIQAEIKRKEEREKLLSEHNSNENSIGKGYCIRCGKVIPLQRTRPMCPDCFQKWYTWNNWDRDHRENYCHVCGSKHPGISMNNPCCSQHQ